MTEDPSHLYKSCHIIFFLVKLSSPVLVVLVGDAGVGKTYLLNKYIRGSTPKNPASTIGVEFATRTVELKEGGKVKAQIWDTAGQERYRSITSAHYRRALGAILVYDITNEKTFENLRKWMEEVRNLSETDITLMLVGNKLDRVENDPSLRRVRKDDAKGFASDFDLLHFETSAITGANVANCFEELLQMIYDKRGRREATKMRENHGQGYSLNDNNRMQVVETKKDNCC